MPQKGVVQKHMEKIEKKLAGRLFGSDNLKANQITFKNPTPMIIYCQDRLDQNFYGDDIGGFSAKFCNDFYPTPTDVGMCMTKNVDIKELLQQDNDLFTYTNAENQKAKTLMGNGNRNAESTYVLLTDIFEDLNPTKEIASINQNRYLVSMSILTSHNENLTKGQWKKPPKL